MRLAFLGSPDFAARCLDAVIVAGHEVACVYSQPARPRGRGQAVTPSPVQALAERRGLLVRTPASMRDPAAITEFAALDLDAAVVVAFGQILPAALLDAPRLGSFNLHASLLPRWRGAAPIQRAIMAGDAVTGVEVMRMTPGLDEGPVLSVSEVSIAADETAASLHHKLAVAGAALLVATLDRIEQGSAVETPQAAEGVTYARKITPAEARIDWSLPAAQVDARLRGLSPFPGAWFLGPDGMRVKALMSSPALASGAPGEVLAGPALTIGCGQGAVRLSRLQREGKAAQDADDFLRGYPLSPGVVLA
ncbi:MAG: methionyl-tRNA formyltransferase [Caulobacteraceae bacterium]|nr:methionyl-tRNA formyltransferase [Caulobacteraceae bacterium]